MGKIEDTFDNKCHFCEGKDKFEISKENWKQSCSTCKGIGLKIEEMKSDINFEKIKNKQISKDLKKLQNWIKKTSTCKTCKGDQDKIKGGTSCKECGLTSKMS